MLIMRNSAAWAKTALLSSSKRTIRELTFSLERLERGRSIAEYLLDKVYCNLQYRVKCGIQNASATSKNPDISTGAEPTWYAWQKPVPGMRPERPPTRMRLLFEIGRYSERGNVKLTPLSYRWRLAEAAADAR